jgi:hypothetical protein
MFRSSVGNIAQSRYTTFKRCGINQIKLKHFFDIPENGLSFAKDDRIYKKIILIYKACLD